MDVPEPARELLDARYGDSAWSLLHAWMSDETVLCLVAIAGDEVFDPVEDTFDVDAVRIEALQLFDTVQDGWEISEDGEFALGDVLGDLVRAYEEAATEGEGSGPEALES